MENWRKLLKEFDREEEEKPQLLPAAEIPDDLYHSTTFESLGDKTINGLKDYNEDNRNACGEGIPFTSDFNSIMSNIGENNLILVFDGRGLAESGQYNFRPYDDPSSEYRIPEIRLEMVDSASDSGAGVDIRVDTLGTDVPFRFVKKMVFLYKLPESKQEWLRKTYPDIGFESFNPENGDTIDYEEKIS
jgi:hypothetical protein